MLGAFIKKHLVSSLILLTMAGLLPACGGGGIGSGLPMIQPLGGGSNKGEGFVDPEEENQFRPASLPPVVDDPTLVVSGHLYLTSQGVAHVSGQVTFLSGQAISQGTVIYVHTGLTTTATKLAALALNKPKVEEKEIGIAPIDSNGEFQFDTTVPFDSGDILYLAATSQAAVAGTPINSVESEIVSLFTVEAVLESSEEEEETSETPVETLETNIPNELPEQPVETPADTPPTETAMEAPPQDEAQQRTTLETTPQNEAPQGTTRERSSETVAPEVTRRMNTVDIVNTAETTENTVTEPQMRRRTRLTR